MATVKFSKTDLVDNEEVDLPYSVAPSRGMIIRDTVYDNSRWAIHHELIFELDGKTYLTYYSRGATECQDEQPWEYDDEISCDEVEAKEVTRFEWVAI